MSKHHIGKGLLIVCLFMRILFCKIICFCKPSSQLYTPAPLRLENTPPTLQERKPSVRKDGSDAAPRNKDNRSRKKNIVVHQSEDSCIAISGNLQSILKKLSPQNSEPAAATSQKKKVQWLDFLGKELAQIREFESSKVDDTEFSEDKGVKGRGCVCSIL